MWVEEEESKVGPYFLQKADEISDEEDRAA
jgi:hypothetical protein